MLRLVLLIFFEQEKLEELAKLNRANTTGRTVLLIFKYTVCSIKTLNKHFNRIILLVFLFCQLKRIKQAHQFALFFLCLQAG